MSHTGWYTFARRSPFFTRPPPPQTMPHTNENTSDATPVASKDKKSAEPLFGPSIGSVSSGPAWTLSSEKKIVTDELTPEIVNGWIEKSKEPSHPTTTLQALVNLKRPTLRLSPLASEDPSNEQHHHGLEFEFDCDAPKCGIYVHVFLPKTHPDAPSTSSHSSLCKLQVFDTVVDGGFGNRLTLEEGALLELGRFEHPNPPPQPEGSVDPPEVSSSGEHLAGIPDAAASQRHRRRFTQFHFRKRSHNHSISGPALAVVDAEPVPAQPKDGKDDSASSSEEGVKVTIRIIALDEQGTELVSPNEQVTYLHIVRFGQKNTATGEDGTLAEDNRPWVVKVVKREATIGPHTFHLHEIYGLTSSSSHNAPPTAPPPTTPHTYPPDETQQPPILHTAPADDEGPQSECLLCLSSPREVVLLPCRHLVACKDCALNMIEFGAGGNITQSTDPAAGGDEGTDTPGGTGVPGFTANTPAPPTNTRRKRKAKGWFCPVCRQPYTSMLRLTTSAPPPSGEKDGEGSGTEDEGGPTTPDEQPTSEVRTGGLLGGAFRPGFLRGLSISRAPPADVENQVANNTSGMARMAL